MLIVWGEAVPEGLNVAKVAGFLLQYDQRSTRLRQIITGEPKEVVELADEIFQDLPIEKEERIKALSELVELLIKAKDHSSDNPLLSARYHLFLRSLEGAFLSYFPQKRLFLERRSKDEGGQYLKSLSVENAVSTTLLESLKTVDYRRP